MVTNNMRRITDERVLHHIWLGPHSFIEEHNYQQGSICCKEDKEIQECGNIQQEIGWKQMFLGRIEKNGNKRTIL